MIPTAPDVAPGPASAPRDSHAHRIFVIDDDDVMLLSCRRILEKDGYQVETFNSGVEGLQRIQQVQPELLLVDLKMPELDGLQVIERVRGISPEIVIAVITGYATISTAVEAMKAGAYDFLPKPFTPDELRLIVNRGHERWRLAAESARLRREKEEAERRFVTFVSHQLKSPVVAAKQYLDVLLYTSKEMEPQTREWLSRAQLRLDEMLALIHDWLELARIEHGALAESNDPCDVAALAAKVVEKLSGQARAAGVTVTAECGPGPVVVRGDAVSLASVLSNLITNAIKYNQVGGRVTVRAARLDGQTEIEVTDTGVGIPAEALPRLFEEFYRVKTDQTRDIPGSGLGLAICRRIVSAFGGSIDVRTRVGEGTTFTVRLPAAPRDVGAED